MADVIVIGAGAGGLSAALVLSRRGHAVTVVERDGVAVPPDPETAFDRGPRRGAPQVRHSHAFLARLRNLLRDHAPDLLAELVEAGASEVRFVDHPPPEIGRLDPEPDDDDLVALACRRTTFDWVLRRHVAERGVRLVSGTVAGLVADRHGAGAGGAGVPAVRGVRLAEGGELHADAVVDASGRRSPLPTWLAELGAAAVDEEEHDTGIVYSTRFYRLVGDAEPPQGLVVADLGYLKYAVFGGDRRTFSITFAVYAADRALRQQLLRPDPFTTAAEALVGTRPWVERHRAEAITGIEVMAGLINRRRRLVVGERPVATGVYAVGDASVCTNPLYGRGCALAMVQAHLLADVLDEHAAREQAAAVAYHEATVEHIEPWYRAATDQDHAGDDGGEPTMASVIRHGLLPAARRDPVVFRAFVRSFNLLQPPGAIMSDATVVARVLAAWQERAHRPASESLGPERDELLRILADAAA